MIDTLARRLTSMLRRTWPLAALLAIAIAGLGFLVVHPEGLFNRHSDLLAEDLATQTILYKTWQTEHRLPLWRPDIFSGLPGLTNPQALYTHPLHILFALFPPERVVGLVIWLQLLVGGLGGYAAGGVLKLSKCGRLLVAVAMLFSFKTIAAVYAGWLPVMAGIASAPLLFAAVGNVMERPGVRTTVLSGLAGGLALHSGQAQQTYYAALFIGIWVSARTSALVFNGRLADARAVAAALAGAAAIGFGLSAYLLLPLLHDLRLLTRGAATFEFFTAGAPLPVRGLATVFGPELFGTPLTSDYPEFWEFVVYFGAVPSVLAVIGLLQARSERPVRAAVIGLSLTVVMAVDTPLLKAMYHWLPGYALFRLPARTLFLSSFFAFCLAGVGLDRLLRVAKEPRQKTLLAIVLIAATALEGAMWARRYLKTPSAIPYALGGEYVAPLQAPVGAPGRLASLSPSLPAYGFVPALGLESIGGYDPFNFRHYQTLMDVLRYNRTLEARPSIWTDVDAIARFDVLDALNVRFVTSPSPLPATAPLTLVRAFEDQPQFRFYRGIARGSVYLYRNDNARARAFFVSDVVRAETADAMAAEVLRTDVRDTAVVLGGEAGPSTASPGDRVNLTRWRAGELDIATHSAARRFLVVSEVWHPGWRATVDGRPAALYQADIALQGLWIDAGDHVVALRFWPVGLTTGLMVTALAACAVIGLTIFSMRRRRGR